MWTRKKQRKRREKKLNNHQHQTTYVFHEYGLLDSVTVLF